MDTPLDKGLVPYSWTLSLVLEENLFYWTVSIIRARKLAMSTLTAPIMGMLECGVHVSICVTNTNIHSSFMLKVSLTDYDGIRFK